MADSPEPVTLAWPDAVTVVDVTPRDGLQDAPTSIPTEAKLAYITAMLDAGVRHIEATSFMHPAWIPQLADADALAARLLRRQGVHYSALIPNMRGYERARAAGISTVALVVSASESHNRANLNRSIAESLAQLADVATRAREDGVALRGSVSTAFGCPFEGAVAVAAVMRVVRAYVAMGVTDLSLADTIGVGHPRQVYELFTAVRKEAPATVHLSGHFHDRSGYGLANVFAALQAEVTTFDAAVGGLGGCPYAPGAPGNLAMEELVEFLERMGLHTGISLDGVQSARVQLEEALAGGVPVQRRTPTPTAR